MTLQIRPWLATGFLLGSLAIMSGCAGDPPDPRIKFDEQLNVDLSTAYQPSRSETAKWDATWQFDKQSVDVAFIAPVTHERVPLIIYLPGLGESASAGEEWRASWAQAGYAVLSIQGQAYGTAVFATPLAQAGDFRAMAGNGYSKAALRDRLSIVQKVVSEAQARAAKGDTQLAAIDWNQVVVAGFDLGAQTAAVMVGAHEPGITSGVSVQPKAALLLSPYVEAGANRELFAQISAPVLSITGPDDEDPFNWVSSYRQRQVLGESVTVAGSYQVELNRATHKTLSGTELVSRPVTHEPKAPEPNETTSSKHTKGKHSSGGAHGPAADEPATDPKQVAAIRSISQAFLDSQLKHSPAASDWLHKNATSWLSTAGRMQEQIGAR
ncbi:alpha/beta hydrolase [Pseudomonas sp. NA-150]|uniref:alpha/beta hydrolase n=1 Tax=Pseudomonas sp. NA-150 TaxID=3367525 RepID=UPI0037CC3312